MNPIFVTVQRYSVDYRLRRNERNEQTHAPVSSTRLSQVEHFHETPREVGHTTFERESLHEPMYPPKFSPVLNKKIQTSMWNVKGIRRIKDSIQKREYYQVREEEGKDRERKSERERERTTRQKHISRMHPYQKASRPRLYNFQRRAQGIISNQGGKKIEDQKLAFLIGG